MSESSHSILRPWLSHPVVGAKMGRLLRAQAEADAADRGVLTDKVYRAVRTLLLHGKASGADVA